MIITSDLDKLVIVMKAYRAFFVKETYFLRPQEIIRKIDCRIVLKLWYIVTYY